MAAKKSVAPIDPNARRFLVEIDDSHLGELVDPARVQHWTRELLKFGAKSDELRRAIATLDIVNQLRDTDLTQQKDMASELRANCDAILVVSGPEAYPSVTCMSQAQRFYQLGDKPQLYFEKPQANTAWLNGLLQHLLQEGAKLGAVIVKTGNHPLVQAAQESLEEIIGLRHGTDEAKRRIVLVTEANAPSRDPFRKINYPERMSQPFGLFTAVGCLPQFLAGADANQFAEGARSFCRSLEKGFNQDDPCVRFTATRLHLLAEKNLRELFFTSDPGLEPLGRWWESIMEPSSLALGNPSPGSISRDYFAPGLQVTDPPSEFGISLTWDEDDNPGQLLPAGQRTGSFPFAGLSVRKREAFSLGAACAFLSCSAAMTHRLINLPFGK